ncbi:hypothetical protein AAC387_Pa12g1742 [Persea americana]
MFSFRWSVVEDSVDCENGGKGIVREMEPYEVDTVILNLMKLWIEERLKKGSVLKTQKKLRHGIQSRKQSHMHNQLWRSRSWPRKLWTTSWKSLLEEWEKI